MFKHGFIRGLHFVSALSILLTTFAIPTTSIAALDNATSMVDGPDLEICEPIGHLGDYYFPVRFTVEGTDGGLLESTSGFQFVIQSPGQPDTDVTEFVTSSADYLAQTDPDDGPWNQQVIPRIASYGELSTSSTTFVLTCTASQVASIDSPYQREIADFPVGTVLTVRFFGDTAILASASLEGKRPTQLVDTDVGQLILENIGPDFPEECLADDSSNCSVFSDVYNLLIEATGQHLNSKFANLLIGVSAFFLHQETEQNLANSNRVSSLAITPSRESCVTTFLSALNVLNYGETPSDTQYRLSAVGRGLADSLTDPDVSSWPEFDACMAFGFQDPSAYGRLTSTLFEGLLYLHPLQVLLSDIPLGVTGTSAYGVASALATHLPAVARIPWEWINENAPTPKIGEPFSHSAAARGLPAPTYAVTSGSLPTGLTLDSITGLVSGTPTMAGMSTFTITATNFVGSLSGTYTVTIDAPTVTPTTMTRPSLKMTRKGSTIKLTGAVDANYTGTRVTLQQLVGKKWKRVKTIRVTSAKKFSASVNVKSKSKVRYRIVAGTQISRTLRR